MEYYINCSQGLQTIQSRYFTHRLSFNAGYRKEIIDYIKSNSEKSISIGRRTNATFVMISEDFFNELKELFPNKINFKSE